MSIDEGLASTDVAKVRAARGAAKGQVTKNIRNLRDELVVEDSKFLFDEIDEKMVQEVYQKLDTAYNQFQDLHEKLLELRVKEADANAEKEALLKENTYFDNIAKDFTEIEMSYVKYKKALAVSIDEKNESIKIKKKAEDKKAEDSAKEMKIALLADVIETSKKKLDAIKKSARSVVESTDEDVRSTADIMKKELTEAFSSYESKVVEYKAAKINLGNYQGEEKYSTDVDYTLDALEIDEITGLKAKLSVVVRKTQGSSESITKNSSNENQSSNQSTYKFVKFKKISPPRFSGKYRDFPKFKRDFVKLQPNLELN